MQFKFDEVPVPTEKLDTVVAQSMNLVRREYNRKKKIQKFFTKCSAAAAVLVLAASVFSVGLFMADPVMAANLPLVGHIFQQIQDDQRYPGNFDEVAQPAVGDNEAESNGLSMTLSEVYSSSEALYVSAMIKSEEAFPKALLEPERKEGQDDSFVLFLFGEQEFDFMKAPESYEPWEWPGDEFEWEPLALEGKYVDDHTFIGSVRIQYDLYPLGSFEIPDSFCWNLKVNRVWHYDGYEKAVDWDFKTDIQTDRRNTKTVEVHESAPNGEVITSVSMTPYEVTVNYGYDESRVLPGYEAFDSIQGCLLDADGTYIIDKIGHFPTSGYNLSEFTAYYWATPDEETHRQIMETIQEKRNDGSLKDYLEEISIQKITVRLQMKDQMKEP